MSRYFQDEHQHQTVLFDQGREDEDEFRIASQQSFDVVAAPPPPMPTDFVPNQAALAATQFIQSPYEYQDLVPSQPVQDFSAYSYPMHNRSGQNQSAQSQPGQIQEWQIQPEQIQPGQYQAFESQPAQGQPEQVNSVPWCPESTYTVSTGDIASWIHIPDVVHQDLQYIDEVCKVNDPMARAEELAQSETFLEWLQTPTSSQLLVHANDGEGAQISGLSLFCVSLRRVLKSRPDRFIPVVFFCGLHVEPPSATGTQSRPGPGLNSGAHGLIRSFIHQLMDHCYFHCPVSVTGTARARHGTENDDLEALYPLFRSLVCAIPNHITVCCLVDGAVYYERDEFLDDMRGVMLPLLHLAGLDLMKGRLKVLFTSPTSTSYVRDWVAEESILSMTELGRPGLVSDEEGLERMLASAVA